MASWQQHWEGEHHVNNHNQGPGHFGNSQNPNYGYAAQRYNPGNTPGATGQFQRQQKPKEDKPIKAIEIKSYLNAWSTKQKLRPNYVYGGEGKPPHTMYSCKLTIGLYNCNGEGMAKSKKEAQTMAAWDMARKLAGQGFLDPTELPQKTETMEVAKQDAGYGGWTPETARQRLNRFCVQSGIDCNIINHVQGPAHNRMTTATLSLVIEKLNNKVLQVNVTAQNKKLANAKCSMEMLKQLLTHSLVEKKGEPEVKMTKKRRNEGGWTKAAAVARLKKFREDHSGEANFGVSESSSFLNGAYTVTSVIDCNGMKFDATVSENKEEDAKSSVALALAVKLFDAGMIEANTPATEAKRTRDETNLAGIRMTNLVLQPRWHGSGRTTGYDDRHIRKKLNDLEPEEKYKRLRVNHLAKVQSHLQASPFFIGIDSVNRVGEFVKGLELKACPEPVDLVVCTKEKPTSTLLGEYFAHLSTLEGYSSVQRDNYIIVKADDDTSLNIHLTSAAFYPPDDQEEVPNPEGMLPRSYCVEIWIKLQRQLYFQARSSKLLNLIAITRILKDRVKHEADLTGISGWMMELFLVRCFETTGFSESGGDSFRRVLSVLASGVLMPKTSTLVDLNETDDLLDGLTFQQRQNITAKSQHYLRLQTFKQIHVILDIEVLKKKANGRIEEPKPDFSEDVSVDVKATLATEDVEMTQ